MDFGFSEEQRLLAEAVEKFFSREYSFERRRAIVASAEGFSREVWRALAQTGVLGLPFAPDYGGVGGGPVETLVVMNAIGAHLVVEPYLWTVVVAGGLIAALGSPAQRAELLAAIASGERITTLACYEPHSRYALDAVATRAVRSGGGWRLIGRKSVVPFGAQSDTLLVTARVEGARDGEGDGVFLVERGASGVSLHDSRTLDGLRVAELVLSSAPAQALGEPGGARETLERILDAGAAALCAEAVGAMEALNRQTIAYLKTRRQFGQPIGRFQALAHRAADMMIHCEQSRSLACLAALRLASGDAAERRRAVSAAKYGVGRSARFVSQSAIQLHGGIGVTNELPAAHYAKRLTLMDFQLGDSDYHLERFIRASAP